MSTVAAPERYRLTAGVIFVPTDDGSARLLDMNGSFYALSGIGAEMLRGVLDRGVPETVRIIADSYGATPERVHTDLQALLRKLCRARLVRTGAGTSRSRRLWRAAAGFIVQQALGPLSMPVWSDSVRMAALLVFARLCFALLGWAETVAAWSRALPRNAAPYRGPDMAEALDHIDAAIRRIAASLPSLACKERALCGWFLLCRQGVPATLVVGIQLFPLQGHCWCEAGSRTLTDFADRCETYVQVARYRPDGTCEPADA